MGTLDDAIREHLDLKRRHGATEDEVKQKEDEAFGRGLPEPEPVMEVIETEEVIEPEPFQGVVPGEEPFAELDDEPQSEPVPEVVPEPLPEPAPEPLPEPAPEPLPEPAPEPLPEPVAEVEYAEQVEEVVVEEPLPPEPRLPDLEPLPEPDFELPAPNEPRNEPLPEPDFELRVSGEPEEAVAGPSDELLDERPDFIEDDAQDDLWFDQKPPKDFNFD